MRTTLSHCFFCWFCFSEYHQFDNVVYPESVETSRFKKFLGYLGIGSEAGKRDESEIPLKPLNQAEMSELCLHVYLDKYKIYLLEGHCGESSNLVAMVEEVLHVYNSLRVQLTIKVGFSSAIDQKPTTGLQYVS